MIKEYLKDRISLNWTLGIGLIVMFSSARFFTVMYGVQTGDNKYLSILFVTMILLPFLLLNKEGRFYAKIKSPISILSLLKSCLIGGLICYIIFLIGQFLYGNGSLHWFTYIGDTYPLNFESLTSSDKTIYFIVFLMIGISFSPFGEELLYRGLIHTSFLKRFGEHGAAVIDSLAFGFVHLAHYGFYYDNNTWEFHLASGLIWMLLMFSTGMILNYCRRISDSVWGAIVAHMAFNATMTYIIFYKLF